MAKTIDNKADEKKSEEEPKKREPNPEYDLRKRPVVYSRKRGCYVDFSGAPTLDRFGQPLG